MSRLSDGATNDHNCACTAETAQQQNYSENDVILHFCQKPTKFVSAYSSREKQKASIVLLEPGASIPPETMMHLCITQCTYWTPLIGAIILFYASTYDRPLTVQPNRCVQNPKKRANRSRAIVSGGDLAPSLVGTEKFFADQNFQQKFLMTFF